MEGISIVNRRKKLNGEDIKQCPVSEVLCRFKIFDMTQPIRMILNKLSNTLGIRSAFNIRITTDPVAFYLDKCKDTESLKKIHACIVTHGFGEVISICSKLVNCYAHIGNLPESKWIIDKISGNQIYLWNSAIVGYYRSNHFDEVICLYAKLKTQKIGIDSSTITFCFKSCIELGDTNVGSQLHVDAIKFGLDDTKFVGSSLVGLYSKYGNVEDAKKVFDDIYDKDIVVYTSIITGYAQLTDSRARTAFYIASNMWRDDIYANRVTLVNLLQASGNIRALNEGKSIHCYWVRHGIDISDEVLNTSVVDMYSKCGAFRSAACVLRQMDSTVVSWNAMIANLIHSNCSFEAIQTFYAMLKEGNCCPDSVTIANVLTAFSDLYSYDKVTGIHGYLIRNEICIDLVVATALVDMYLKCGKVKMAKIIFDDFVTRDELLYNVMISGYLLNNRIVEGIRMFREMVNLNIHPNSATMLTLLSTFAHAKDTKNGKLVHGVVIRNCFDRNINVANQIIYMYSKWGYMEKTRMYFDSLHTKDLVSWTSIMAGYVNHGKCKEALSLFQLMRQTGERFDSVTIITLLQLFSQTTSIEKVREIHGYLYRNYLEDDVLTVNSILLAYAKCSWLRTAEYVFNSILKKDLALYNTMISSYGIHGDSMQVLETFHRMCDENIMPDEMTFSSVLSACSHAGLIEEGCKIFHSMNSKYFSIVPNDEHFSCMIDMLGRASRLEEAYDLIKCLPIIDRRDALYAVLAACRVHMNFTLGEIIGKELLELDSENSSIFALVSNFYSEAEKWNEAANLRNAANRKRLRKIPGYSMILEMKEHT